MRRSLQGLLAAAAGLMMVTAGLTACKRTSVVAKEPMLLLPRETGTVIGVNLPRVRETPLWRRLLAARDASPEAKERFADFTRRTEFDPFTQIDTATLGFAAAPSGDFGVILRGKFNPTRMAEWLRSETEKQGRSFTREEYEKVAIYGASGRDDVICFLDERTMVVASRAWVRKMIDLALGRAQGTVRDNQALAKLAAQVRTSDALWIAGEVGEAGRERLRQGPGLQGFGDVKDLYGSLDFAGGLKLELSLHMGSEDKAGAGLATIGAMVDDGKRNPQLALLGLIPYLDKIKTTSQKDVLRISMSYTQAEVDQLIERLQALFNSLGVEVTPTLPSP